jgi:hypothetical protein
MARDHAFQALERFARRRCWRYLAPWACTRAMAMVMEPAVSVRFLQLPSHADFDLPVQQRRK